MGSKISDFIDHVSDMNDQYRSKKKLSTSVASLIMRLNLNAMNLILVYFKTVICYHYTYKDWSKYVFLMNYSLMITDFNFLKLFYWG